MKPSVISAEALFEQHRATLHWEWLAGHAHPERRFDEAAVRDAQSAADLVGYLNYIHPYRVQIVGVREVAYLYAATPEDQERRIQRIVTLDPPVVVIADGQAPPERLVSMCDRAEIPLFVTAESAGHVIDVVRNHLSRHFAERTTRHGVFMDILGLGVLLTGESGLGKSELGLELISRGHGMVADDAVDLYRVSQTAIEGRCPELLMNLLEVRGIGLLDIKAIFGETAVRRKMVCEGGAERKGCGGLCHPAFFVRYGYGFGHGCLLSFGGSAVRRFSFLRYDFDARYLQGFA